MDRDKLSFWIATVLIGAMTLACVVVLVALTKAALFYMVTGHV